MKNKNLTKQLVINALGIALVIIATSFLSMTISSSFINLGDVFIFFFGIYFGPVTGLLVGGFGSFFADVLVHPSTMVYTLFIKGLEGLVIGLCAKGLRKYMKNSLLRNIFNIVSMLAGSVIMVGGYFLAKAFIYGNMETALISLTNNIIQAIASLMIAILLTNIFDNTYLKKYVN